MTKKCSVCFGEITHVSPGEFRFNTCSQECARTAILCKTISGLFPVRYADGAPCVRVGGNIREVNYLPSKKKEGSDGVESKGSEED